MLGAGVLWTEHHLALVVGIVVLIIPLALYMKPSDPYGLFHLSLNKLPGESPDTDPQTEWLNMGYWKDTNVFPEACEALALKLITAAKCEPGGNVLDVGYGSGESLILQLSHPRVSRPSRLTGITSLKTHHQRSSDRITGLQSSQSDAEDQPEVMLYHGDAIFRSGPDAKSNHHPLDPSSSTPSYTTVLALDCAYHFNPRSSFLRQSFHRLSPGGRIALADICFTPTSLQSNLYPYIPIPIHKIVRLSGLMASANVISPDQYVREMQQMGYVDIQLEDISKDVFPGFTGFLKKRGGGWWLFGGVMEWWAEKGMRFVVVSGQKPAISEGVEDGLAVKERTYCLEELAT